MFLNEAKSESHLNFFTIDYNKIYMSKLYITYIKDVLYIIVTWTQ